ncbi:MAG: hypothetical protein IKC22_00805 [Bacilli bacterium]|nr:hypothetical protein [bacterium]MBR2890922.1 hypothetical protein [Bacilli bacterium]
MGYYKAKNIKIDRKNNKISGVLADSNWRDFEDKFIYESIEDLYPKLNVIEDKIANLYYDIICGNIHTSNGKYEDLVCSFDYIGNGNFTEEFRQVYSKENRQDYELYNVFKKYEDEINKYAVKNCVLRRKGSKSLYIVRLNKTSVSMNYVDKEKAKKFNAEKVKRNSWYMENYDIEYI